MRYYSLLLVFMSSMLLADGINRFEIVNEQECQESGVCEFEFVVDTYEMGDYDEIAQKQHRELSGSHIPILKMAGFLKMEEPTILLHSHLKAMTV